jgi:hypothetical protein
MHFDPEDGGVVFRRKVGFYRTVRRYIPKGRTVLTSNPTNILYFTVVNIPSDCMRTDELCEDNTHTEVGGYAAKDLFLIISITALRQEIVH